jgi:transcriptional regulator with XRE-family HTH domain
MGDVITDYRRRRGYSLQKAFAIAAGVSKRTIEYWETEVYILDTERRIFLAKLLRIPPALLGLTVYSVLDDKTSIDGYTDMLKQMTELAEEDSYYAYEDILIQGWEYVFNGRPLEIAPRINRRLRKLVEITKNASLLDREAWQYLLFQFYQLYTNIMRHFGISNENKENVLQGNAEAERIAKELDDVRLLADAHYRGAQIHMEHDNYHLAKQTIQGAVDRMKQVALPVRANICLVAANANAVFTENDTTLEETVKRWLDTALTIVHNGKIEDDPNLPMKPHLAAVHHEKAKTFLQFHKLHPRNPKYLTDARRELNMAWGALTPDLSVWHMYFALTESRLFLAEHDIEGSTKMATKALQQSRLIRSMKGEGQARDLYFQLKNREKTNPYIDNLGVELGIF